MRKKFLMILTAVTFLVLSFVLCNQSQYEYSITKANKQFNVEKSFSWFNVPIQPTTNTQYKKIVSSLATASRETHVNFLKRQVNNSYVVENGKINYGKPIEKVTFQVYTTKPTVIYQNFGLRKSKVKSDTRNLNKEITSLKMNIIPIQENMSPSQREGDYYIETKNIYKYKQFLRIAAKRLSKVFNQKYTLQDFIDTSNYKEVPLSFEELDTAEVKNVAMLMLTVFVIIFGIIQNDVISKLKLKGFSIWKTFVFIYKQLFYLIGLLTLSLLILLHFFLAWHFNYRTIGMIGVFLLFLMTIAYSSTFFLFRAIRINQLGKSNSKKWSFLVLFCSKSFLLLYLFVSLVPVAQVVLSTYTVITAGNYNREMGEKYALFYPYINGNNGVEHTNQDIMLLDKQLYPSLNKLDSVIFDSSGIKQPDYVPDYKRYIDINPNYLANYPIYDEKGQRVKVKQNEKAIVILIPIGKNKQLKKRTKYINMVSQDEVGTKPAIKFVMIKNKKILNLDKGDFDPVASLWVTTPKNSSYVERNMMNGQGLSGDGLKVPITSSLTKKFNEIKPKLKKYGYLDNYPQLVYLNDLNTEDLKIEIGNLFVKAVSVLSAMLVTLILSGYVVELYFKLAQRKIVLKKVNGYSLIRRYAELFLLLILQYVALFVLGLFSSNITIEYIILIILLCLVEIIFCMLSIKNLEKNVNIQEILNGK